jgi:hypothetical protein
VIVKRKSGVRVWGIVAMLFFISGCAAQGTGLVFSLQQPPAGSVIVYHYRQRALMGSGMSYDVVAARRPVTRIGNGGYFVEVERPGRIDYLTKTTGDTGIVNLIPNLISNSLEGYKPTYTLEVAAGEVHFLRWTVKDAYPHVEEVSADVAEREMQGLKSWPAATMKE